MRLIISDARLGALSSAQARIVFTGRGLLPFLGDNSATASGSLAQHPSTIPPINLNTTIKLEHTILGIYPKSRQEETAQHHDHARNNAQSSHPASHSHPHQRRGVAACALADRKDDCLRRDRQPVPQPHAPKLFRRGQPPRLPSLRRLPPPQRRGASQRENTAGTRGHPHPPRRRKAPPRQLPSRHTPALPRAGSRPQPARQRRSGHRRRRHALPLTNPSVVTPTAEDSRKACPCDGHASGEYNKQGHIPISARTRVINSKKGATRATFAPNKMTNRQLSVATPLSKELLL